MRTAANLFAELAKDPQFTRFLNAPKKDSKGKKKKSSSTPLGQQGASKKVPNPPLEAPKEANEAKQLVPMGQGMQMQGHYGSANPMDFGQPGMHAMMGQPGYFGGSTIFHAMVGQGPQMGMHGTEPYGMQ